MSEQTAQLVARLRDRLRRTSRRMTWAELAFGTVVAVGVVATVWLLATVLEASLWLGTAARTALAASIGTVAAGMFGAVLAQPIGRLVGLLPGPSDEEVARKVGNHYPTVADRLVNLLQLAEGKRSHSPVPLVDQAVEHLADDLDDVSFTDVEDFERVRGAFRIASFPLAAVVAFLLVAPATFLGASERLLAPTTEFDRPAPFRLSVVPGDTRVVRGDSVRLRIRAPGTTPATITLQMRDAPQSPVERLSLQPDTASTFAYTVPAVRRSFQYRISAPPLRTDWYDVTVVHRPLVRQLQLTVSPPSYTDLPSRKLDPNVGDVSGLPGSRVTVSAALGGPKVDRATLRFDSGNSQGLEVRSGSAQGTFTVRRAGTYQLHLESSAGTTNRDPITYQISLQSDARPSVTFLQPEGTRNLDDDLTQQLRVKLSDDYGFSQARLYYRLVEERFGEGEAEFSSVSLPVPHSEKTSVELVHEWLLAQDTGLEPEAGDVIAYYVKAWDNDAVNGPKSGRTVTQRLRRPSLSEQYERLDDTQEEAGAEIDKLQQRSDSVDQQFQQLRQELRRTREADWQDRRQLERIQQKQESVEQGVKKLSETIRKMNRQMQRNGLSSPETAQKFKELQRVIDEINSPELQKALDQLRKAMQNNNLRQMQRAMEQVEKNEQSYQEQLERTLSLFKQLEAQQKLEEMARRAGELSDLEKKLREKTRERMNAGSKDAESEENGDRQDAPSDSTARGAADETPSEEQTGDRRPGSDQNGRRARSDSTTAPHSRRPSPDSTGTTRSPSRDSSSISRSTNSPSQNEDLAREQERAGEKMRKLMREMNEATDEMKEVQSAPKKQLNQMNRQLKRQNMPKQMQKNSEQLRQNQLQDAQQGQQQMQKRLQQMKQQLSQMKGQMQGRQRQMNVAGLRSALENTLHLSKRQESLRTTVGDLASQGPTLRSYARDQKTLSDGLKKVADSLASIASRVPRMSQTVQEKTGNALRAMETATSALDERSAGKAMGHQKTSMMHLNELALLLSDLLDKLQKQKGAGSGMSMQQMMQKLRKMTGQQQKLNKQIQQHLKQTQGERLSKDQAQRRKELAKQQRQIRKQLREMGKGSQVRDKILGDLDKIAEQMEKTAQQLEQRRPSRQLIKRQQQILTRLLNAQKSLRTQGKQEKRRGRKADDDHDQRPPGELPSMDEADRLRQDLIRALEMGYSPDYEELIKRYFELLQRKESEKPRP